MSFTAERIFELLPSVDRLRDGAAGGTLRALIEVIAGQVAVLEEDVARLLDDQFIETCAPWIVPYIGDLIGFVPIGQGASSTSSRSEVANTISYRRRKGTAVAMQQLARDVTGLPATVVEYFKVLATTQSMRHVRPENVCTPDLRDVAAHLLDLIGSPFDRVPRSLEVRRIEPRRGRYDIPNAGVFLWRLRPFTMQRIAAGKVDAHRYTFDPLGSTAALFVQPPPADEFGPLAGPLDVPAPLGRRFAYSRAASLVPQSFEVIVDGASVGPGGMRIAELAGAGSGWDHVPGHLVLVDPELGRIAFPASAAPKTVVVSYAYGFSSALGGGEYARDLATESAPNVTVAAGTAGQITAALAHRTARWTVGLSASGRYDDTPALAVTSGDVVTLLAAQGVRPMLALGGDLTITGAPLPHPGDPLPVVRLDGVLISGGAIVVKGGPVRLELRDCTLVPGLARDADGNPANASRASITFAGTEVAGSQLDAARCITGAVVATHDTALSLTDSIVDATAPDAAAIGAAGGGFAGDLTLEACTVAGRVAARTVEISNSILFARASGAAVPVNAELRQSGCVRYSYVPPGSLVPRAYACQPALAGDPGRVAPLFTSLRYGDAAYAQLDRAGPDEIRTGSDDGAEMGAFHREYLPRREAGAIARLAEYTRFGIETGIFYAT
jgi:hypothetical protein